MVVNGRGIWNTKRQLSNFSLKTYNPGELRLKSNTPATSKDQTHNYCIDRLIEANYIIVNMYDVTKNNKFYLKVLKV